MTREEAIRMLRYNSNVIHKTIHGETDHEEVEALDMAIEALEQPESTRTFVELVTQYPDPELCIYKEYKGKPYYSIKYIENGEEYVGYGTYSLKVLSQYLKKYFMPFAQSDVTRCKDCQYREESETIGGGSFIFGIDTPDGSYTYYPWMPLSELYKGEENG